MFIMYKCENENEEFNSIQSNSCMKRKRRYPPSDKRMWTYLIHLIITDIKDRTTAQNARSNLQGDSIFSYTYRKVVQRKSAILIGQQIRKNSKSMVSSILIGQQIRKSLKSMVSSILIGQQIRKSSKSMVSSFGIKKNVCHRNRIRLKTWRPIPTTIRKSFNLFSSVQRADSTKGSAQPRQKKVGNLA